MLVGDASAPWPPRELVRLCFCNWRCSSGLRRHCDEKDRALHCAERGSARVAAFWDALQNRAECMRSELSDKRWSLSVGYPTLARIAISSRSHPRTVE